MKLAELFDYIAHGELAQHYITETECGTIDPSNYGKIIPNINLGLLELHKRFNILEKEVLIQLTDARSSYPLRSEHAVANTSSTSSSKFIMDTTENPFNDDVLFVTEVSNEFGETLFKNNKSEQWSVYTPEYDVLEVPFARTCNMLNVLYRASPKHIPSKVCPDDYTIHLSPVYLNALLLFIYSKYQSGLSRDKALEVSVNYNSKFEKAVLEITKNGWSNEPFWSNTKFDQRGFQ